MTQASSLQSALATIAPLLNGSRPRVGMILGSGLGSIADDMRDAVAVSYVDIPGFHKSNVEGHAGRFLFGKLGDVDVALMQGRYHYYEGIEMDELAFPIKVMAELGVQTVIITSASGGVNESYSKGDIVLLRDHINFVFRTPFTSERGTAMPILYPAVNQIYDPNLIYMAEEVASDLKQDIKSGVYFFVSGPSYETKAEIRMIRKLGGDTVGMSTVPEAVAAVECGMRVLGITYISNMACGIEPGPLVHSHVMQTMDMIRNEMLALLRGVVARISTIDQQKTS